MNPNLDTVKHPLTDTDYATECRDTLDADGALVLKGFFTAEAIAQVVAESSPREHEAYYADSTHNVYLTPPNPAFGDDHPFNRQVASSKGLIADDQIPSDSPLRSVYNDPDFRSFLCRVLGIEAIHSYADDLSSINVHFAPEGRELGWHFDNSSFAVTMLLQAPEAGGQFEYVAAVRDADADMALLDPDSTVLDITSDEPRVEPLLTELPTYERVGAVLDGTQQPSVLHFEPGDLVMFRGRNAMHRITPTIGDVTRMLVVFAFNDQPGVGLSESALQTFFGRTS